MAKKGTPLSFVVMVIITILACIVAVYLFSLDVKH